MSKLSALLERMGGIGATLSKIGDTINTFSLRKEDGACMGRIELDRMNDSIGSASLIHLGGISCGLTYVPDVAPSPQPVEEPYLEIEPTVVWVYADLEAMNDVFSNTNWIIN